MDNQETHTPEHTTPAADGTVDKLLGILNDVEVEITVELGRRRMRILDANGLKSGEVLELDKLAGQPLELRVNGRLVARGDAVVIGEHYAIRVTEVVEGGGAR
jgi:flagellar motor switch protein FliN